LNVNATVIVRKRGAIGIFYPQQFVIRDLPDNADRDAVFAAWQAQYGDAWEPRNLQSYAPVVEATAEGVA